ncbi:MAG: peptidylprolyl isomerase [Rhodospirillales bacterium]|nr:peptidylprolyl isomerase [Rhodospirillales bacterium]
MRILIILLITGLWGTFLCAPSLSRAETKRSESIIAIVNNGAVSASELEDRMRLIIVSSGMPDNREIRDRMRSQILASLIDEQIKLQEADRLGIEITDEQVDQGFISLAESNNMTAEQFSSILKREHVSPYTLRAQIRANMAWSDVVQSEVGSHIVITDSQVDSLLARLTADIGKTEFLFSEIFLPVEEQKEESNVKQLADRLIRQLLQDHIPFPKIASQFSQSAGASRGGDMGWVQQGQLAPEIEEQLAKMEEGDLSQPIRTLAGYHILYLRKKRTIAEETIPSADALRHRMGVQELERQAQRYLLDLKSSAFIEHRNPES